MKKSFQKSAYCDFILKDLREFSFPGLYIIYVYKHTLTSGSMKNLDSA